MTISDGTYRIDVALEGGSGRAAVTSPAELTAAGGEMTARIEWSSPYYDLMIVDGERYYPLAGGGNAVFEIPVLALDAPLAVEAETTAMSEPHLIAYELTFDPDSIRPAGASSFQDGAAAGIAVGAVLLLGAALAVLTARKRRAAR